MPGKDKHLSFKDPAMKKSPSTELFDTSPKVHRTLFRPRSWHSDSSETSLPVIAETSSTTMIHLFPKSSPSTRQDSFIEPPTHLLLDSAEPDKGGLLQFSTNMQQALRRSSVSSTQSSTSYEAYDGLPFSAHYSSSASESPVESDKKFPYSALAKPLQDIFVWLIPHRQEQTCEQSVDEFRSKLTPDYYDCILALSKKLDIHVAIRVQTNPGLPSNRRYSLTDPDTEQIIATAKTPPLVSKTNAKDFPLGHIARRAKLQEKRAHPMDNNIPGALPDALTNSPDRDLTTFYQQTISNRIKAAYKYYNLVCWTEFVPAFSQIGDEYYETGKMVPKHYIQEAVHIYWLINKIVEDQNNYATDSYKMIAATNKYLLFSYKDEQYKIMLNKLMPPLELPNVAEVRFNNLKEFSQYVHDQDLQDHHAPVFYCVESNSGYEYVPEMVLCGPDGHITGDADIQHYGKEFWMPSEAYATFAGDKPENYVKFMVGLELLQARLTCATKAEYMRYIKMVFNQRSDVNILDYISIEELTSEHYTNYMDKENTILYDYYQNIFLPILQKTIAKYQADRTLFSIVCHSDIYSLVMQVEINHPLSIHADEITNLKAGEIGAVVCVDNEVLYGADNEASLLAALLHDREILAKQVIGVNPYYLRDSSLYSTQWLDVISIRCLNAALINDFEFKRHWQTITRVYNLDKKYGPMAIEKVNQKLDELELLFSRAKTPQERDVIINMQLDEIYTKYAASAQIIAESLKEDQFYATAQLDEEPCDIEKVSKMRNTPSPSLI